MGSQPPASPAVKKTITDERPERAGYFNISNAYESIHEACMLRTTARILQAFSLTVLHAPCTERSPSSSDVNFL